jgi:hypothetical protein
MDDYLNQLKERFGDKGIKELARIDGMSMSLLYRLYLVSTIASNIYNFNEDLAKQFYNTQTLSINSMMKDLDNLTQAFQKERGEI